MRCCLLLQGDALATGKGLGAVPKALSPQDRDRVETEANHSPPPLVLTVHQCLGGLALVPQDRFVCSKTGLCWFLM